MSVARRFSDEDTSVFRFKIDTTKIVVGATNGSENPLKFKIPVFYPTSNTNSFIIRVSDGRADVSYTGSPTTVGLLDLTFSTAGVYTITLIGKCNSMRFIDAVDKLKLIEVLHFPTKFNFLAGAFQGCSNCWINAQNGLKIASAGNFFNGIKGFGSNFDLGKLDLTKTNDTTLMLANITTTVNSTINAFLSSATSISGLYNGIQFGVSVNKIEIIAPLATNASNFLLNSNFQGRLIIKAPLTNIFQLTRYLPAPISLGEVDIRYVTASSNFFSGIMSVANVDATLLGWANNFDWAGITSTTAYNFNGSKHSNSPNVLTAKAFLQSKGITFTNLTMA